MDREKIVAIRQDPRPDFREEIDRETVQVL